MSQSLLSLIETSLKRLDEPTTTITRLCLVARPRFGEPGMDISHTGAVIVRRPDSTFTVWSVYVRVSGGQPRVVIEHGYYDLAAEEAEAAYAEKMKMQISGETYRREFTRSEDE